MVDLMLEQFRQVTFGAYVAGATARRLITDVHPGGPVNLAEEISTEKLRHASHGSHVVSDRAVITGLIRSSGPSKFK